MKKKLFTTTICNLTCNLKEARSSNTCFGILLFFCPNQVRLYQRVVLDNKVHRHWTSSIMEPIVNLPESLDIELTQRLNPDLTVSVRSPVVRNHC